MTGVDHENEKLRVLIVDDEPLGRRSVARQVAVVFPGASVDEARDGLEALEKIAATKPSIVFLDVEMPELSGLDVLRQLPVPRPKVVFVTAFEAFAVAAFEEHACDYLVKPFTPERFARSARRALEQIEVDERLSALERGLSSGGRYLTRLSLRSAGRVDVVPVADIGAFVSEGHYTYVWSGEREYLTELTLVHLEERLDPATFIRAHRNAIVNAGHVARVKGGESASVELRSGRSIGVSRRHRAALLKRLG
ncbi:MAG: LytTR family DNA-binding domain-containing protein [Polyangiaceae bacterium]